MDLGLKNKIALVLGSSDGIGKAVAKSLVDEGAKVILNSRNAGNLERAKEETGASDYVIGDLSQIGEAKRIVEEVIAKHGKIDILISNTGGPKKGEFSQIDLEQWQQDYQSLWLSFVEATNTAVPSMQKSKWGRIVLVTSLAAREPLAGLTTSNGLRAGLSGLAKSLSSEIAKDNITVNCVLPGYTNTDRLKALNLSEEKVRELVPMGRLATPQEVGDLCCFLSSDKAGYVTGQSLLIDGGASKGY